MLLKTVQEHYQKSEITDEELAVASKLESHVFGPNYITHGEYVVRNTADLETFTKRWRWHFLETMDPQFMPDHWDLDRSIYRAEVQKGYKFEENGRGIIQVSSDAPPAVEQVQDGG